jgi:adenosylcobinamide-GDP ribazoletransferase
VAGALLGAIVGGVWWAAGEVFPPLVAGALAVVADVVVTGALHVDGLADSADGVLPHLPDRARRAAVMAAPDVGAFGVAAVVGALLLRWAAMASVEPDVWLVVAVWAASRSVMALALATQPYVGGGLGAAFAGSPWWPAAVGLVAAGAVAPVEVVGLAVAAAGVVALARRRLGGVSGDILGALGVVGETVALVLATRT